MSDRARELLERLVYALDPARNMHYRDAIELRERALTDARAYLRETPPDPPRWPVSYTRYEGIVEASRDAAKELPEPPQGDPDKAAVLGGDSPRFRTRSRAEPPQGARDYKSAFHGLRRVMADKLCDCGPAHATDPAEHREDCGYTEALAALPDPEPE